MKQTSFCLVALLISSSIFVNAQTTLLPFGSSWKYLDNGTNQGTAWSSNTFDDTTWKNGLSQLGYGDGDEATLVSFGNDPNKKYITTYFRKVISISDPTIYAKFILGMNRDDGAIVY